MPQNSRAEAALLGFDDLYLGREEHFEATITEASIDAFAALSGDKSPIHMDAAFARSRGFEGRVVHGVLLSGLVSRLLGMYLPGENCLLQQLESSFISPAYAGDAVSVSGKVHQVSPGTGSVVIKAQIVNQATKRTLVRARATVGFTRDLNNANRDD